MKLFYNYLIIITKIILPALICAILIFVLKLDIGYHVLFFSLVIILFNFDKSKYSYALSVILSAGLSYIVFFISIAIYFGIGFVLMQVVDLNKLDDVNMFGYNAKQLLLLLPVGIISPILMFLSYQILFKIEKNSYFKIIKYLTIIMLTVFWIIRLNYEDEYSSIYWQFVMALALQLILYEKEIKSLFKANENHD